MRVIIDRIEDGVASVELENGSVVNVPAVLFEGCKDGDIVDITVNKRETERKRNQVKIDVSKLFE